MLAEYSQVAAEADLSALLLTEHPTMVGIMEALAGAMGKNVDATLVHKLRQRLLKVQVIGL
jgi:hypothetical protein